MRAALAILAVLLCALAAFSDLVPHTGASDFARLSPILFTVTGVFAGIAYFVALRIPKISPLTLWIGAVVFRLILLPAAPGDDIWRYRWEGRVQAAGMNPYQYAPDAPELAGLRDAEWPLVNHPEYPAAYPPGAQVIFRAFAGTPVWLWKLVLLCADLGVVALLARWRDPAAAAAYAWNPLIIYVSAGGGHFDVFMVLALVASAFLLERGKREDRTGDFAWSALLLGLAIVIKLIPLVLVPVWFFAFGWRRVWLLILAVTPLPLGAVLYGWPGIDVFGSIRSLAFVARTNDCLWWLTEKFIWANTAQKNAVYQFILASACAVIALLWWHDWRRGRLWVLGAVLVLSPALHPWYLAWILPFAILAGGPARAWLVFSVSNFAYFLLWLQPVPWVQPAWLHLLILLPPLGYLVWHATRRYEFRTP